jgi:hypothetical protein
MMQKFSIVVWLVCLCAGLLTSRSAWAQLDQGTITGVVQDNTGAVIPGAKVTLTNTDNGLVLQSTSDGSGIYNFSPVKIGNFTVSASAPGFETTSQQNVHLDVQQRLNVVLVLKAGAVTQTVTVTTAPALLQTQQGSVGQVLSTRTINDTPLNGRNWVYIAQLTNGVDPSVGSRGGGKGDFEANGQRAEQNNFVLDGVDNNVNVVDFLNGATFVVRPPPDALAEFKVDTSDYSAEFGHSAGAVVNASIKSGTNQIHGDFWEYFRNNVLDAKDWEAQSIPKYRENQFGATLGFPIIPNKLFFFGDVEANRIVFGETSTETVPTALMRKGNFSELLNTGLSGQSNPVQLYQPNSGGGALLACNGQQNVFCPNQIDPVAQRLLNLYPLPNANGGKLYQNYVVNRNSTDNTWQWDARMDYNFSAKDQIFARFSYLNEPGNRPPPLGPILDGGGFGDTGAIKNIGENFASSETHIFSPTLSNEFRFGYNYGHFGYFQTNYNTDIAPTLGLGGIPFGTGEGFTDNGGLPYVSFGSGVDPTSNFGAAQFYVSNEHENVYQILDNVTKILGNHSLKFGVDFQSIRFATLQPPYPRGTYSYNGLYTSNPLSTTPSGFGLADFLANQNNAAQISNETTTNDVRWYRAGYFQDDWRVNTKLTVNLGLRYDYYQPYKENAGHQATYHLTGPISPGHGSAVYQIPSRSRNVPLVPTFTSLLASNNIALQYVSNQYLINAQNMNFAPRIGFAYSIDPKTVVHGGYGIFYGGLESTGYYPNLGENYPFQFASTFPAPNCTLGNCPSIGPGTGIDLENGFSRALAVGLQNFISTPALRGSDATAKTPYTMDFNIGVQHAFSENLVASIGYVGDTSRHLQVFPDPNNPDALVNPGISTQAYRPFPGFGGTAYTSYTGMSDYNSMQAKLQKRFANGLSFLATYTWAHSLDDAPTPLGSTADGGFRNTNLLPIHYDYSNSPFDVRNRVTFNGLYELPYGVGRAHMNHKGLTDTIAGGWAVNLTFVDQSGPPMTVYPDIPTAGGGSARAILIGDPFAAGGTPNNSNNPGGACAPRTKTKTNWYNPCAFANPLPGATISPGKAATGTTPAVAPQTVTNTSQVLAYLGGKRNQIPAPGYERVNMSIFKDFATYRAEYLEFRVDIFNVFNTPSYGYPSTNNISPAGGQITGPQFFQNFTPDARFFQLSAKYIF